MLALGTAATTNVDWQATVLCTLDKQVLVDFVGECLKIIPQKLGLELYF